jgi:ribosomal protein S18 acetylase RimI-like enzyme
VVNPTYRKGLGDDTGRYVRVEHGYIEYRYTPGNGCEIVNIEVQTGHRREGVGRKLLEKLFREIDGKADRVYAITRADNEIAQQFYESTGFNVASPLRRFYSDERHVDAVLYVRSIRGPV